MDAIIGLLYKHAIQYIFAMLVQFMCNYLSIYLPQLMNWY